VAGGPEEALFLPPSVDVCPWPGARIPQGRSACLLSSASLPPCMPHSAVLLTEEWETMAVGVWGARGGGSGLCGLCDFPGQADMRGRGNYSV
jgi:hypothetical protein